MMMLPLVQSQSENFPIGFVEDLYLKEDRNYDNLLMGSKSEGVTILPQGLVYITKERAQDRTIPSAHLIVKNKECHAFCVQSSQPGLMQGELAEKRQLRLLPASVRLSALRLRNQEGYSALWDDLGKFNSKLQISGNYLTSFFENYQKQLNEFVAQFEPVPNQRGAVIIINNQVAGIEIMPDNSAFLSLWEPLIRDCYGSQAILQSLKRTVPIPVILDNVSNLEDLPKALHKLAREEREWAELLLKEAIDQKETWQPEEQKNRFVLSTLTSKNFAGQIVQKEERTVYLSLLRIPA
jgi:hypothetical protein